MSAFTVGQGVLGAAHSRRGFLRLGMVVSAAGLLAACGKGSTALPHGSNPASPAGAASVGGIAGGQFTAEQRASGGECR